jgi:membrane protease YdiL (CAAX protease family)
VGPARIVGLVVRLYAVLSALGALLVLAFVAILISAFGMKDIFEPKFFSFVVMPGIVPIALAPFVWRGRVWAMFAVLAIAVGLTFLFSRESPTMQVALPGTSALFAVFTGVRLWLGQR